MLPVLIMFILLFLEGSRWLTSLSGDTILVARKLRAVGHASCESRLPAVHKTSESRHVEGKTELLVDVCGQGAAYLVSARVHQSDAVVPGEEREREGEGVAEGLR